MMGQIGPPVFIQHSEFTIHHYILRMPRGLAIETSGRVGSVALAEDGRVVAEDEFPHGLQHAAEMLPRIDRLCRHHGWGPADLKELYVSAGPGSFTGLRIGVTMAKTLAFATGARIVAVPSVEVLAANAPPEARHVLIVLDAKRDQVFTAYFSRSQAGQLICEIPAHLDELSAVLARVPRPVHLIGEGIEHHRLFIPSGDTGVAVTPPALWRARAASVAAIGMAMARQGQFTDPDRFTPIYIRKPEAQEKWEQRHAEDSPRRHEGHEESQ